MRALLTDLRSASALARAIVDTVREPLLVLDVNLNVTAAGQSFYTAFGLAPEDILGISIFEIIDSQLSSLLLRSLLGELSKRAQQSKR